MSGSDTPHAHWHSITIPRLWLLAAATGLLMECPHLLATGRHQSGKSWLLRQLAKNPHDMFGSGPLVVHYELPRKDDHSVSSVTEFVDCVERAVDEALGRRLSGKRRGRGLEYPSDRQRWQRGVVPGLRQLLNHSSVSGVVILIDGVDQDTWQTGSRVYEFVLEECRDLPEQVRMIIACSSQDPMAIRYLTSAMNLRVLDISDDVHESNWRQDYDAYFTAATQLGLVAPDAVPSEARNGAARDFRVIRSRLRGWGGADDWGLERDLQAALRSFSDAREVVGARRLLGLAAHLASQPELDVDTAIQIAGLTPASAAGILSRLDSFIDVRDGFVRLSVDDYAPEILRAVPQVDGHAMVLNFIAGHASQARGLAQRPYLFAKGLYHVRCVGQWSDSVESRIVPFRNAVLDRLTDSSVPGPLVSAATESYLRATFEVSRWRTLTPDAAVRLVRDADEPVARTTVNLVPQLMNAGSSDDRLQLAVLRRLREATESSATVELFVRALPWCDADVQTAELWRAATTGDADRRHLIATRLGRSWPRTDSAAGRVGAVLAQASADKRLAFVRARTLLRFGGFAGVATIAAWVANPADEQETQASSEFWERVLVDDLRLDRRSPAWLARWVAHRFASTIGQRAAVTLGILGLGVGNVDPHDKVVAEHLLNVIRSVPPTSWRVAPDLAQAGPWAGFIGSAMLAATASRDESRYLEDLRELEHHADATPVALYAALLSVCVAPAPTAASATTVLSRLLVRYWQLSELDAREHGPLPAAAPVVVAAVMDRGHPPRVLVDALRPSASAARRNHVLRALATVRHHMPTGTGELIAELARRVHVDEQDLFAEIESRAGGTDEALRDWTRYLGVVSLSLTRFDRVRTELFLPAADLALTSPSARMWAKQMPTQFVNSIIAEGYRIGRLAGYSSGR